MSRLLQWFRPHQEAIWRQLSEELGGDFRPGNFFARPHALAVRQDHWTVLLDTYKKPKRPAYTRLRALYVNRDAFHFRIFRKGILPALRKKMAQMQDIEVGHPDFDRAFIIQGNDPEKLRMLFSNALIRKIIEWQPEIHLFNEVDESWVTDPWMEGLSELRFEARGVLTDLQQLRDLYDLFAELLNQLCHIGSAYEQEPQRE